MKKMFIAAAALLFAASCAHTKVVVEDKPLENTTWKLVELYGEANPAFAEGDSFTFTLDEGSITGKGSVNRFFGGYEFSAEDGVLDIGELGMTRMLGPNEELENSFVGIFDNVDGCSVEGEELTLKVNGEKVAVFKAWSSEESEEASVEAPVGGIQIMTVEEAMEHQKSVSEE